MRSREEVEAEVRKKIESLSKTQRKERHHLVKIPSERFSTIELRTDEEEYPIDIEGHKQHLLDNFDESVITNTSSYSFKALSKIVAKRNGLIWLVFGKSSVSTNIS